MSRKPVKGIMPTAHRLKISAGVRQSLGEAIDQSDVQSINSNSRVRLPDPGWMVATIFNKDKVPVWFCVSKDPNRNFLDQTQRKPNEFGHGKFYGHEGLTLMVSPRVFYDKDEAKAYKDYLIQQWGITTSEGQRPPYSQSGKSLPGTMPRRSPKKKYQPTLFERIKGFFANLYQRVLGWFKTKPAKFGSPAHRAKIAKANKAVHLAKAEAKAKGKKPYTWSSPEARQANIEARVSSRAGKHGRSFSEEDKANMREKNLGQTRSDEVKAKISKGQTGRVMSEETKAKLAKSNKKAWAKKKRKPREPMSDEQRLKLMIGIEARKALGLPFGRPKGSKNKPKRKPYTFTSAETRQAVVDAGSGPRKK